MAVRRPEVQAREAVVALIGEAGWHLKLPAAKTATGAGRLEVTGESTKKPGNGKRGDKGEEAG